jgi:hypothetical protein
VNETRDRPTEAVVSRNVRDQLAVFGGHVLWRVVGVAVGVIAITAEVAFELEMQRLAARNRRYAGQRRP